VAVVDSELKPFAAAMLSPLLSLLAASAMRPPPAMMPTCRALPPRMSSAQVTAAAVIADTPPSSGERSALVLGWFFAKDRELDYVRRMYEKNGFTDIVIKASQVAVVSKPRGWYRSLRARLPGNAQQPSDDDDEPDLDRHFDVVHCMSGGFLALYVMLQSGVKLRFSQLLFDSTPILPKPAAFTKFARAYLRSIGLTLPLKLLPKRLHQGLILARWWISIYYIQLKHRVLSMLGRQQDAKLDRWQRGPVKWALRGDYDRVSRHALGTIYDTAAQGSGSEIIFLYNPDDPFISETDVSAAADLARTVGLRTKQVHVGADHIKAIFKMPRTLFDLIGEAQHGATHGGVPTNTDPAAAHDSAHDSAAGPRLQLIRELVLEGN